MCNTLKAITKAVSKVISRVYLPRILGPMMIIFPLWRNAVRRKIPHLWVPTFNVLLHSEKGALVFVFSIAHITEFLQVRVRVLFCMDAAITRAFFAVPASALFPDFGCVTMADVGFA